MSRPDLNSDEAILAYRAEVRAVGRTPRFAGLACVVLGASGWALMLAAIFMRTRYHRRRMAELD
jgi:hypothetical protein